MSKDYIEISENKTPKIEEKAEIKIKKSFKINSNNGSNNYDDNNNNKINTDTKNQKIFGQFETNSNSKEKIDDIKQGKWLVILTIIILAYFIYPYLTKLFMNFLQNNPSIYRIYLFIFSEINNNTLIGLFMVSILGALFFMILPSEAIFIYFINSTLYNPVIVILMVILGSLVGLTFNYFFGRLLGEKIVKFLFKKNFEKYKNTIDKWGGTFVFLGNIFPGPMEILSVFFGVFKYDYKKFMLLSGAGRLIKYTILFLAFTYFWETITSYYEIFLNLL